MEETNEYLESVGLMQLVDDLGCIQEEISKLEGQADSIKTKIREFASREKASDIHGHSYYVTAQTYRRSTADVNKCFNHLLDVDMQSIEPTDTVFIRGSSLKELAAMTTIAPAKFVAWASKNEVGLEDGTLREQVKPHHTITVYKMEKSNV